MTLARSILGIVPGLQATSLVVHNIPKDFKMKSSKKMDMKGPIKRFAGTIVGIGLMKPTAKIINAM